MPHAKYSPSSSKIWMQCPGMPSLMHQVEYKVGMPAAVGTLIHSMTEMLLKERLENATLEQYWLGKIECVEDFEIEVDKDMIQCAEVYVSMCKREKKNSTLRY